MRRVLLMISLAAVSMAWITGCQNRLAELEEQRKATVRRIHAELVKGNVGIMDDVLASNYVRHCQAMPPEHQELSDIKIFKAFLTDFVGSVSNYTDTVTNMVAEGDMVAYVSTMTGTQTGPMGDLPASGKDFTVVNIIIHRFEGDKIAESWVSWDNLAMLAQLGFFPPPPPDAP